MKKYMKPVISILMLIMIAGFGAVLFASAAGKELIAGESGNMVKLTAVYLAFAGLAGMVRDVLKARRFTAPAVAASIVIIVLMAGGFIGALYPSLLLLYAAGYVYWLYGLIDRRHMPDVWLTLAGLVVIL